MLGEASWYNDPLSVAVVAVVLTLATTRIAFWFERRAQRKEQGAALKIAFAAEIESIVRALEPVVRDALAAWKKGESVSQNPVVIPRTVYEANAAHIGEIGDKELVYFLVMTYSRLYEITQGTTRVPLSSAPLLDLRNHLSSLLLAWQFAVAAHSVLRQTTRDTVPRRTEALTSQEDADRLNVTVDFVNDLLHDAAEQPREIASSMERIREKYPRAYERWSSEDDDRLRNEFNGGKSVKELSTLFGRQASAIRSRVNKLGLT